MEHRLHRYKSYIFYILAIILSSILISMLLPSVASAAGAVGSGGTGGGGGSGDWGWTPYGHGFAKYSSSGNGPTDGFHTGNWSTVKNACQAANASSVIIYIIGTGGGSPFTTPTGDFMGYDWVGYSNPWGSSGTNRDNNRASRSYSPTDARTEFFKVPPADRAGYTFGSNVSWFCADYAPPTATLDAVASGNQTVAVGTPVVFDLRINASDRSNLNGETFRWRVVDDTNGGEAVPITDTPIQGANPRAFFNPTLNPPSATTQCYTIQLRDPYTPPFVKPDSNGTNNLDTAQQCVTWINPPSAQITPRASASNTDYDSNPSNGKQVALWVDTSASYTGADTFGWYIETNTNGGVWSRVEPGSGNVNTVIAGGNPRIIRTYTIPGLAGNYCYRIIATKPSYATWGTNTDRAQVCFNVTRPASYSAGVTKSAGAVGNDYEKGGPLTTVNHNILVSVYPCDYTLPVNSWVNSVNWQSRPYSGGGSIGIGGTVNGTVEFQNCGSSVRVNGAGSSASPALLTSYTPAGADLNTLNNANPGDNFGRETFVQGGTPSTANTSFEVYEAPFARFFGNDVKVCGPGSTNRFSYDNRTVVAPGADAIDRFKGSFSEYASIFLSTNQPRSGGFPNVSYEGLQSSAINTSWDKLLSNYTALTSASGNCTVDSSVIKLSASAPSSASISSIPSYNAPTTIQYNGNITISGDIFNSQAASAYSSTFDPDTFPIMLIYATGDININAGVKNIDAVLVAGGEINTCSAAKSSPASISSTCDNPLKINGAVVAKAVNLQRSGGTRYKADASSPGWEDNISGGNTKASEIIEYPWYLNYVNFKDLAKDSDTGFKAYYGLPPRL